MASTAKRTEMTGSTLKYDFGNLISAKADRTLATYRSRCASIPLFGSPPRLDSSRRRSCESRRGGQEEAGAGDRSVCDRDSDGLRAVLWGGRGDSISADASQPARRASSRSREKTRLPSAWREGMCAVGQPSTGSIPFSVSRATTTLWISSGPSPMGPKRLIRYQASRGRSPE